MNKNNENTEDISKKDIDNINFGSLGRIIFSFLLIFYGFFTFLNPQQYPILGRILSETNYSILINVDTILGIGLMILGTYILLYYK